MKKIYLLAVSIIAVFGIVMVSCRFEDPLVDDNGEKINLVRLDLPKFDARYTVRIVNIDGLLVDDVPVELSFSGKDANSLITDAGRIVMKEQTDAYRGYRTARFGMLNVNLNPNYKVASHPVNFQINGSETSIGEYIIIPKIVSQTVAGDLNVDVTAVKINPTTFSERTPELVTVGGANATKLATLSNQSGNGYMLLGLYRSTENATKSFTCTDNSGQFESYGIYLLGESMEVAPLKTKEIGSDQYFIVAAKPRQTIQGKIVVEINSAIKGVAVSLPYIITTTSGTVVGRGAISGILPFTATIEQIFVHQSASLVNVRIDGTSTYSVTPTTAQTATVSASATPKVSFTVLPDPNSSTDLRRCDISVVGICSTNKQIAFYPTIRFQYSLKDTKRWESAESKGGKIVMMLEPGQDYTIRIPINNAWQEFNITTDQTKIEAMVRDQPNVSKFELVTNSNGSMNLKVEYKDQEFCDLNL